MSQVNYSPRENMAVAASRLIKNNEIVMVGTGLPLVAAILAKYTHAPEMVMVMEAGPYNGYPMALPSCVAEPRGFWRVPLLTDAVQLMGQYLQKGMVDVGFLGGAQIDKYGSINSTCIGDYRNPKVRLEGSGGASDIAALAKKCFAIMAHEPRRIVEQLDYLTTPGWKCYRYPDHKLVRREELGLSGGPEAVVTTMGIMKFDAETREMYVAEYYADLGITLDKVQENTGFVIDVSRAVPSLPPSEKELQILREVVDPEKIYMN